jgi:hypothetical protein
MILAIGKSLSAPTVAPMSRTRVFAATEARWRSEDCAKLHTLKIVEYWPHFRELILTGRCRHPGCRQHARGLSQGAADVMVSQARKRSIRRRVKSSVWAIAPGDIWAAPSKNVTSRIETIAAIAATPRKFKLE